PAGPPEAACGPAKGFADAALARRLEAAEAGNARCYGSEVLEIAGGCAVFAGVDSPLTQAVGMGLNGPVSAAELDAMDAFFRSRGAAASVDLCPLASPELIDGLSTRGYRIKEFNNVLVKRLAGAQITFTPHIRRAVPGEQDLWAHTVGCGFFEQHELTTEEMDVGRVIFSMGAQCFLAVSDNGEPAGGGALTIHSGLAMLFADSTITRFRRLGLHRELISARLNEALARACDLATASTLPGSASQRNYERLGFEVAYTKVTLTATS
ncbi:MAG TPA: GNAT family N-acetyltransferase, partial [Bryobacteraceae bacterium]|nr:GNAT family N-acetyltransferase [Bryobacteraceae bacterium]